MQDRILDLICSHRITEAVEAELKEDAEYQKISKEAFRLFKKMKLSRKQMKKFEIWFASENAGKIYYAEKAYKVAFRDCRSLMRELNGGGASRV